MLFKNHLTWIGKKWHVYKIFQISNRVSVRLTKGGQPALWGRSVQCPPQRQIVILLGLFLFHVTLFCLLIFSEIICTSASMWVCASFYRNEKCIYSAFCSFLDFKLHFGDNSIVSKIDIVIFLTDTRYTFIKINC